MSYRRWISLGLALSLIVLSWWGVTSAQAGLVMRSFQSQGVPLIYLAPQQAQAQSVPGVLVAHGFAGSKQLMLGYGNLLARAGYAVMLWDFEGHGANPRPLQRSDLQPDLNVALDALLEQSEVDPTRLALLGHSMGSGVVMSAAINQPDRFAATIAISPTGADVTPEAPRNLQLQAGVLEENFISNAERLLAGAGGPSPNLADGQGRELIIIPRAEHITIVFSSISHRAALRWLNATFNQTVENPYSDRRMLWYGVHGLGWLLVLAAATASEKPRFQWIREYRRSRWPWVGLLISPIVAGVGLLVFSQLTDLQTLGGIQVGGAVGAWFLLAGVAWQPFTHRFAFPRRRSLPLGLAVFIVLWLAFGAMAQVTWLQWWLIPSRLQIWLPLAIACFPWFLASGMAQQDSRPKGRLAWWLAQSLILIAGFGLVIYLLPQLGFMFLLLPLFPPLIAVFSLVTALLREPWSSAIGIALFFGWLLAAGFPLAA